MIAVAVAVGLSVACSPFGATTSDDIRPPDPESDPNDSGVLQPIPGGGTDDGGGPYELADGGVDAGALPPCFGITPCDDFERDSVAGGPYGWTVLGAAHLAGIQGGPNLSPRRSLVIGPITDTNAFITRGVAANARRFRVVFGMSFTSETDDVSTLQLASVAFGTRQFVIFQAAGTDFELVEQDLDGQTKPKAIGAIDRSGFARYELFVDKNAGLARVLRNGSELGSIPITITLVDADSVRLGATYTAGGAERTLRFDDVGFVAD